MTRNQVEKMPVFTDNLKEKVISNIRDNMSLTFSTLQENCYYLSSRSLKSDW